MDSSTTTTNASHSDPSEVLSLLKEQVLLYGKLELLASKQRDLIAMDDTGPLLKILAARQRLSGELADIAKRLSPVRKNWDPFREMLSDTQRAEADSLLSDAEARLARLLESDERDAKLLAAKKQSTSAALRSSHTNSQALSAYSSMGQGSSRVGRVHEES